MLDINIMDSDNFMDQLKRYLKNNDTFLYKAINVSSALEILMNMNLIDANTLVAFDLDGTLFVPNGEEKNLNQDVLLPEIQDTFPYIYSNLKNLTNHTAIITGRSGEEKKKATFESLINLGLNFKQEDVHFISRTSKNIVLKEMLKNIPNISRFIYIDDFMFHNGAHNTIQGVKSQFPHIKYIGIKVGNSREIMFGIDDDFDEEGRQIHRSAGMSIGPPDNEGFVEIIYAHDST